MNWENCSEYGCSNLASKKVFSLLIFPIYTYMYSLYHAYIKEKVPVYKSFISITTILYLKKINRDTKSSCDNHIRNKVTCNSLQGTLLNRSTETLKIK